jgi:hypothetical protein
MKKIFSVSVTMMVILFFWMGYACATDNGGTVVVIGGGTVDGAIGGTIINGGTIIGGGIIGPIYNTPVVKTHTVKLRGLKIVYTRETYTWAANNKLAKRVYSTKIYNSKGQLLRESGREFAYDINGKPQSQDYKRNFDYTYMYNGNGQIIKEVMENSFYDAKNKYLRNETHNITYTYYEDGRVNAYQDAYTCTDRDGNVTGAYCTVKEYTYYANGDFYEVDSSRDSNGNLHPFGAYITIMDGQQKKEYGVSYDIGADGQIAYTHTYELNGMIIIIGQNDIPAFSGAGYRSPVDIVAGLRNQLSQEYVVITKGDTGAIERINVIQSGAVRLPQGVTITGTMANKSAQVTALQARK